jgi:glycosyltransferase involved in cell wall biosynthesis
MEVVVARTEAPLVSVVIPVYNAERFLHESLDCVLAQDHPRIEIIAVDDGSTDASPEVLARYGDAVRVVRQDNAGPSAARNTGIRHARGDYVAFLDADDLWHPAKVSTQVAHLEANPEVGLVFCNWLVMDDEEPAPLARLVATTPSPCPEARVADMSGWLYHKLLLDCYVHTSTAMIRRALVEQVGPFDRSLPRGEDHDYWLRLSRLAPFTKLSSCLSVYRLHAHGTMQKPTPANYGVQVLEQALARWGRRGPDGAAVSWLRIRDRLGWLWFCFGAIHVRRGDRAMGVRSLRRACLTAPWRLAGWKLLIRSKIGRVPRDGDATPGAA